MLTIAPVLCDDVDDSQESQEQQQDDIQSQNVITASVVMFLEPSKWLHSSYFVGLQCLILNLYTNRNFLRVRWLFRRQIC